MKYIGSKNKKNEVINQGLSLKIDTAFEMATQAVTETVVAENTSCKWFSGWTE